MARLALYLSLAGFAGALRVQDSPENRAVTVNSWTRDLFGFVQPEYSHTPYGFQQVPTHGGGDIAPFWTFRTNEDFVLDSHGIQRKLRSHAESLPSYEDSSSSFEDSMQMAGTEVVSEHEVAKDVPTRPKHGKPGEWARGEVPGREQGVELGFVPVQIYSQMRRYDSEEHLPRERAAEEADDKEELLAAPRLREVLRNKKLHEVYEEEGYEDLGYDHGGYNHQGVKIEEATRNEKGLYRKPPPQVPEQATPDSEQEGSAIAVGVQRTGETEQQVESRIVNNIQPNPDEGNKLTSGSTSSEPKDRMDSAEGRLEDDDIQPRVMINHESRVIFPGKSTKRQYTTWVNPIIVSPDIPFLATTTVQNSQNLNQNPQNLHHVATFEPSSYYYDASPSSFTSASPIQFASTINAYASLINENISSPILHSSLTDDVPQPRLNISDEYALSRSDRYSQVDKLEKVQENHQTNITSRKDPSKNSRNGGRRRGNSRGSSNFQSSVSEPKEFSRTDSSTTQTKSPYKKSINSSTLKKNKIYSNLTRGSSKYNPEDDSQRTPSVGTNNIRHPSLPIDSGEGRNEETSKLLREPSPTRSSSVISLLIPETVSTTKDPSANAKYVEQLTLAHFSAPVYLSPQQSQLATQDKRLSDLARQLNSPYPLEGEHHSKRKRRSTADYSQEKYPYYDSPKSISRDSALKYATNSKNIPKKTYGGMEFYESKENIKCNGPTPPKNVTPEKEEEGEWEEDPMPQGERVKGVGNAIDCFKKKYFGRNPLDNPFFKEDEVYTETDSYESRDISDGQERTSSTSSSKDSNIRKIMFIENPNIFRNSSNDDSEKRSISSDQDSRESIESSEDASYATRPPPRYSSNQYSVYESDEVPKNIKDTRPKKFGNHEEPNVSRYLIKKKNKPLPQYVMQPVSVYSIISTNDIPPHHAPLLIPDNGPKFSPTPLRKENTGRYTSEQIKEHGVPKYYQGSPQYNEQKILVTKREADTSTDLWNMMNPLNWLWPSMFDSRRDEPRYRRSSDISHDDIVQPKLVDESLPTEVKPPTSSPISLAEFKVKFNISEAKSAPKKISTRLTGGFINRNPDITDAIEDIFEKKPTEASTSSTIPTTTIKPKVIFPRAKIPRRKAKPPKKTNHVAEASTEGSTTTTTTTLPPPTTTRMYKPKKLITKTFGRGPFNAFTVLSSSREVLSPNTPFERMMLPDEEPARRTVKEEEDSRSRNGKEEEDSRRRNVKVEENNRNRNFKEKDDNKRRNFKDEEDNRRKNVKEEDSNRSRIVKDDEDNIRSNVKEEEDNRSSSTTTSTTVDVGQEATHGSGTVSTPGRLGENQTLTYMVDPVSGVGSWGEQRKWKPKRKRPNTPSVYSYGNATFKGAASRKLQRDIPDRSREVYVAGQLTRLSAERPSPIPIKVSSPKPQVTSIPLPKQPSRQPPKYILEPNKRRYYYAKV